MKINFNSTVNAPCGEVFDVFSDFKNAAARIEGIESIEFVDGDQIGVGTRFRETRVMFGRESTEEMEITEFEPGKKYTLEAYSCGAHFQSIFNFSPVGNSTNIEIAIHSRPLTLFAKLMSPLGFLMASSMKKMIGADIDQLKAYCESNT